MNEFRGFIAIEVPSEKSIIEFEGEIKKIKSHIKLVEPENIHITLKFLGQTSMDYIDEIEEIIKDSVKNIEPFEISFKGTGVFPNENYIKIIWIGITNIEPLKIISQKIDDKLQRLGYKKEKKNFSAHLTIGRVKTSAGKEQIIDVLNQYKEKEFFKLTVNKIELKQSTLTPQGPIYKTLKEINL